MNRPLTADRAKALREAAEDAGSVWRYIDPPECLIEKWCDMPGGHTGRCRSADDIDLPEFVR